MNGAGAQAVPPALAAGCRVQATAQAASDIRPMSSTASPLAPNCPVVSYLGDTTTRNLGIFVAGEGEGAAARHLEAASIAGADDSGPPGHHAIVVEDSPRQGTWRRRAAFAG